MKQCFLSGGPHPKICFKTLKISEPLCPSSSMQVYPHGRCMHRCLANKGLRTWHAEVNSQWRHFANHSEFGPTSQVREEKSVHDHHRKKIFWGTFLASKKNFPGRWWIQKPCKNQENHIHHRNLSSVDPIFFCKEKFCAGAGQCMLSFSQQVNLDRLPKFHRACCLR